MVSLPRTTKITNTATIASTIDRGQEGVFHCLCPLHGQQLILPHTTDLFPPYRSQPLPLYRSQLAQFHGTQPIPHLMTMHTLWVNSCPLLPMSGRTAIQHKLVGFHFRPRQVYICIQDEVQISAPKSSMGRKQGKYPSQR